MKRLVPKKLWRCVDGGVIENFFHVCTAWYKHERGWENSRQFNMQIRDKVKGLKNCREFSQPRECLYQAMQTQEKTFSIASMK